MRIGAYERGAVIPVKEALAQKDALGALVESEVAKGAPDRAFYALELARTRRFAADMLVKRDEPRPPAPWVRRLGDRLFEGEVEAAKRDGRPPPTKEAFLAEGFGRDPVSSGEAGGTLVASSRGTPIREGTRALAQGAQEARKAEAADDDRFWEELKLIEGQLRSLASKSQQSGMTYGSLFKDRCVVVSTLDARLTLGRSEALVEYYVSLGRALAFVVTSEGARVVEFPTSGADLARSVAALRAAIIGGPEAYLQSRGKDAAALEAWRAPARDLHRAILAPVEAVLAESKEAIDTLLIVASGPLANCPFAVLDSGAASRPLAVERYRIAYEPSFSIYKSILSRELTKAPPRLLAVGNTSLALAPKEAQVMGAIFDGSAAWIGPRAASEARFYASVKDYNVLHLATHGLLVPSAPRLSHVLLGPDATEDGFLTCDEVMARLDLRHLYVAVLSACQTALSAEGGATADAEIASITSAFLLAGAPSVVGSLWSVSDESTTRLMVDFYAGFLEVGTAEALRRAQLALHDGEDVLFRHPFYWAAFGVYGLDK